ncbi:Transmembrane protein 98 [Halotydeus destructor]|nr:Transmembrane protein 98 [Halotydeus destructor]
METVVIVAIAVLAVVFAGSLSALVFICYHRYYKRDFFKNLNDSRPDVNLINPVSSNHMELDDVQIHPEIDRILADAQWVDDATGLIPHCLAILKSCHQLTERLVGATMSMLPHYEESDQQKKLWEIIKVAQRISPRVDDVVTSMYPPLDPRLLESRCQSLVMSVSQLAMVIRWMCLIRSSWVDDSLGDLDKQIKVLRDAGEHLIETSAVFNGGVTNLACTGLESEKESELTVEIS